MVLQRLLRLDIKYLIHKKNLINWDLVNIQNCSLWKMGRSNE